MNLAKKNRFKYGSLAIGLTVVVVAAIIVFNAVFSALSNHFFWYFDMTPGQIYSLSDKTVNYIDKIDGSDNKITIYFFAEKDAMGQSVSSSNNVAETTMWGMKPIHELALQLSDRYEFITVDYIDATSQPDKLKEIVGEDYYATTTFSARNILVVNNTYERSENGDLVYGTDGKPIEYTDFKLCARNSFYLFDYSTGNVNAFRGDYYFASLIMSLTKIEKPTVYFLTGHGEQVGDTSSELAASYGNAAALYYLFEESGFNIRKIDLKYDSFDPSSEGDVLVIYAPQRDITSSANTLEISETDKIKTFLEGDKNSMMLFIDSKSVGLSNLELLVKDTARVDMSSVKAHDSGESSVSVDGYSIVGKYSDSSETAKRLLTDGMANKVIFRNSYPVIIPEGETPAEAVVLLPETSGASKYDGTAALMTLTEYENGGKILVSASALFANNETLESDVYSNKNLLISALSDMNFDDLPLNIGVKLIRNEGLDRTENQARIWTVVISAVIPAAVAVIGAIVYVRRKHS